METTETTETTKMMAPKGVSGVSHAGEQIAVASDGSCDVPTDAVSLFQEQGFRTQADVEAEDAAALAFIESQARAAAAAASARTKK